MQATAAKNTLFKLGSGSPLSYATVKGVTKIGLKGDRDQIDITELEGTSMSREFIAGLGKFTIDLVINYNPLNATQLPLQSALLNSTLLYGQLVLASSMGTFTFTANIASFGPDFDPGKHSELKVSLQVTGDLSFA